MATATSHLSRSSRRAGHIAFAQDSEEIIAQALRAAADFGHDWVGAEHMLVGLIRVDESRAAQILRDLGSPVEKLDNMVANGATPGEN